MVDHGVVNPIGFDGFDGFDGEFPDTNDFLYEALNPPVSLESCLLPAAIPTRQIDYCLADRKQEVLHGSE